MMILSKENTGTPRSAVNAAKGKKYETVSI